MSNDSIANVQVAEPNAFEECAYFLNAIYMLPQKSRYQGCSKKKTP